MDEQSKRKRPTYRDELKRDAAWLVDHFGSAFKSP